MSCLRVRVGRNLGEEYDARLASIAYSTSGYFVAVGGLGYFFATEEQPSQINRGAHRSEEEAQSR
jgi:hypothetical protein